MLRKRTRRSTARPAESHTDALFQSLQAGALSFLPLPDMVSVLNTCRMLRRDRELPMLGLAHASCGPHLLRTCSQDWMNLHPSCLQAGELLQDVCDAHPARTGDAALEDLQRLVQAFVGFDARRGQGTALLSAMVMMERKIIPLCYREDEINTYGDICTARPVLLPLELNLGERADGYELTSHDVKTALNALSANFGEDFVATRADYMHVSDFGAHWESAVMTASRRVNKVNCRLCESAKSAIKEYRKQARASLRRFNDVLREKKDEWRAAGLDSDKIYQRRSELKAEFFPEDSYPDVNFAEGLDDEILADICESGQFPMNPFDGMASGFDRFDDDVFNALREEYVGLCASLFQPLKQVLMEECRFLVGQRVFRTWMGDEDGTVKGELVAGVTMSGFLCGVYLITRRVE